MQSAVTIHEAKTNLSRLVARAETGEEVILARGKNPVAKIVALVPPVPGRRTPGRFALPPGSPDMLADGFWDDLPLADLGLGDEDAP